MFKTKESVSINSISDKQPLFTLPDVQVDPETEILLTALGFAVGYVGGFALTFTNLKNGNIQRLLRKL